MGHATRMAVADDGRTLPVLPDFETVFPPEQPVAVQSLFRDSLLLGLIESRSLQRLKRISFLGAAARMRSRNWDSRYAHSLGVAGLASLYAWYRDLPRHDTRVLAVAGLLHDIGHGPLSHTLEPVFRERFDVSHHGTGARIIRGELPIGREIPQTLASYGLDADEIVAMIEGTHHGPHAFLFSSPINLDTIEGITRCHSLYGNGKTRLVSAAAIVGSLAAGAELPTPTLDAFWRLKHEMYNRFIHYRHGLLFDGLAQAFMYRNIDKFAPRDFLKDEEQLRRSNSGLFKLLDQARRSPAQLRNTLPGSILDFEFEAPTRKFRCNRSVKLKRADDLTARYSGTANSSRIPIYDLFWRGDLRC